MAQRYYFQILLLIIAVLVALLVFSNYSRAECTFVWKPGMTTLLSQGHKVAFIVEDEDKEAFKHQRKIDESLLPLPPMDSEFEKSVDKLANVHRCGDYRDLTDGDLE